MSTYEDERKEAKDAMDFIKETWAPAEVAFQAADTAMAKAKVEVGLYLFKKFGDNDLSTFEKKKFSPKKKNSYSIILNTIKEAEEDKNDFPIKSKSTLSRLVRIGYQHIWALDKAKVDTMKLVEQKKIGYTGLVYLIGMKNEEPKIGLLKDISQGSHEYTVADIKEEILKRTKRAPEVPPDFNTVMEQGWLPRLVVEDAIGGAKVANIPEDFSNALKGEFFNDIHNAVKYGFDESKGGVNKARVAKLDRVLRDAAEKAQNYVNYIHKVLSKLPKEQKSKNDGQAAA
jgi:hypothetical protein